MYGGIDYTQQASQALVKSRSNVLALVERAKLHGQPPMEIHEALTLILARERGDFGNIAGELTSQQFCYTISRALQETAK